MEPHLTPRTEAEALATGGGASRGFLEIAPMAAADEAAWDGYVRRHRRGTFFHRAAWSSLIEHALGHHCHFLLARRHDRIVGVLPLVEIRTGLFGKALVSTGFTVGGGPLADNDGVEALLVAEAERICDRHGLDRIEFRGPMAPRDGWVDKTGVYAGFAHELEPDVDANLARVRKKQQAMVRKAMGMGLTATVEHDAERFIPLYANAMHRHGTPMLTRDFYRSLFDCFEDDCDVLILEQDGAAVAGFLNFYHNRTALPYYAGGVPAARAAAAHDLLVFELMRHAITNKSVTHFDFGRSKIGTGSYDFKRHWGFTPTPITYSFRTTDGRSPPEINPLNPKYHRKIEMWRRLPGPMVDRIGPWIARQLG